MNFFESFGYVHEDDVKKGRFLIEFSSVYDIPIPSENFVLKTVDPYIRSCIVKDVIEDSINDDVNTNKQITSYVYTPHLHGCSDVAIFNSYRDFNIIPPPGSYLQIELFHYKGGDKRDTSKQLDNKRQDLLLGSISIPIISLLDERPYSTPFRFHKYGNITKNPSFSIIIRRLHIKTSPPMYKTIFLLRHGESKWNEAQEKKDYKNLLNRDHPLTQAGIQQAEEFNNNWRDCEKDMITCFGPNWRSTKREFTMDFYENLKIQDIKKNQKQCDATDLLGMADISNLLIDGKTYDGEFDAAGSRPPSTSYAGRDAGADISSFFGSSNIPPAKPPKTSKTSKTISRINENGNAESQEELDRQSTVSIVMRQTRREEFRERFLCADKVYCSPLTRAIQTAYVGLQHHPAMMKNGLLLMSIIREIKGIAGFDSIGIAHGDAIRERVKSEFSKIVGQSKTEELMLDLIYANDAIHPWWTPIQSFDTKSEQLERVLEFVNFTRYCGDEIPIFVGHSLFFKLFCSQRISSTLMKNRPALAANLRRYKLSNATVIALALKYYDDGNEGKCDCEIVDADLIFGGGFHGGDDHETLNDDRVRVIDEDGSTRINDLENADDDFGGATATLALTKKVISDKLFELQSFSKKIMSKIL